MGVVFRATHVTLGRVDALKAHHPNTGTDPHFVERFLREARAMARLDHENIMRVYDVFEEAETYYIAMEFFPGESLKELIAAQQSLPVADALIIGMQAAAGLAYAHSQGIVHRDIKPGNIMLGVEGKIKITDFGIAAATDESGITSTGQLVGSPKYMSPEQARGERVDGRSDLYSLGMVLYEMLTGATPFDSDSSVAVIGKVAYRTDEHNLAFPHNVPLDVEEIIRRLLRRDSGQRYSDATSVYDALFAAHQSLDQQSNDNDKTVILSRDADITRIVQRPPAQSGERNSSTHSSVRLQQPGRTSPSLRVQRPSATQARSVTEARESFAPTSKHDNADGNSVLPSFSAQGKNTSHHQQPLRSGGTVTSNVPAPPPLPTKRSGTSPLLMAGAGVAILATGGGWFYLNSDHSAKVDTSVASSETKSFANTPRTSDAPHVDSASPLPNSSASNTASPREPYERAKSSAEQALQQTQSAASEAQNHDAQQYAAEQFSVATKNLEQAKRQLGIALDQADRGDYTTAKSSADEATTLLQQADSGFVESLRRANGARQTAAVNAGKTLAELKARVASLHKQLQAARLDPELAKSLQEATRREAVGQDAYSGWEAARAQSNTISMQQYANQAQTAYGEALQFLDGISKQQQISASAMARKQSLQEEIATQRADVARARNAAETGVAAKLAASELSIAYGAENTFESAIEKASKATTDSDASYRKLASEINDAARTAVNSYAVAASKSEQAAQDQRAREALARAQQAEKKTAAARAEAELQDTNAAHETYQSALAKVSQGKAQLQLAESLTAKQQSTEAVRILDEAEQLFRTAEEEFLTVRLAADDAAKSQTTKNSSTVAAGKSQQQESLELTLRNIQLAYEAKDLATLSRITEMSAPRRDAIAQIFQQYRKVSVSVSKFSVSGDNASAELYINKLVNSKGEQVVPAASWRSARIVAKKGDAGWEKFAW